MTIITLSLTIIFTNSGKVYFLVRKFRIKASTSGPWMLHQLDENCSSAKKNIPYGATRYSLVGYSVCVPLLERKMYQPVEIDNKRALISCEFIHQSGRLFSLMSTISLVLSIIDFWLLNWIASSLRRSCWVTNSSL